VGREKVIGPFHFPTRKAAETAIRAVLNGSQLNTPLAGDEDLLIRSLVTYHPTAADKIGPGITAIEVRIIDYGARGFWLSRSDGSAVDFSYKKALDGAPNHRALVISALRHEVRDQIEEFRRRHFATYADLDGAVICPLTQQRVFMGPEAHVDHSDPSFVELAERYADTVGGFDGLQTVAAADGIGHRLADRDRADEWQQYHRQLAVLRVVHRSANLARFKRSVA
jgi:hypothetical protein